MVRTTSQKPRLLVITTTFPRFRDDPIPAAFVLHHAKALAEHFEVTVLAPHHPAAAREEMMEEIRIKRFRYAYPASLETLADGAGIRNNLRQNPLNWFAAPLLVSAEIAAVRKIAQDFPFINSHWLVPSGLAASLLPPGRAKHIITVHAADYDLLRAMPGGSALVRFMTRRAHALVCVSERLANGLREMAGPETNIKVCPMGVDTGLFRFLPEARTNKRKEWNAEHTPVILFAGKLTAKKGVPVLLEAAAALKAERLPFKLVIAGEGMERARLETLAASLNLEDRISFIGAVPNRDMPALLSAADAVAVPSLVDEKGETEGMPVIILEALAAGRPVVATRVCSVPPSLQGRGVVVVEENNPTALTAALKKILEEKLAVDPAAVESFDVRAVARFYADLFLEETK